MVARLPECLNKNQQIAHIMGMLGFASLSSIPAVVNSWRRRRFRRTPLAPVRFCKQTIRKWDAEARFSGSAARPSR
jgi:hypothetical protein